MTINDQIRDEKLQYDINREAAKISEQIIEQAKFTYCPLGKAFEKQIKTFEDQGKEHIDALENLKPKEETRPIDDKSNNKSKATIIFNGLINKRKALTKKLRDSVDYNNLKLEYVGPTKDVSFYEFKDSIERFNEIKNSQNKFSKVKNKQKVFLNKLNTIKIGKKNC